MLSRSKLSILGTFELREEGHAIIQGCCQLNNEATPTYVFMKKVILLTGAILILVRTNSGQNSIIFMKLYQQQFHGTVFVKTSIEDVYYSQSL